MTLRDEIQQVIDGEPVAIFMKGTPERPACGNSLRALQALWNAGAPISAVDVLPDPRIRQELSALTDWPTIPQVFVNGELIGGADITEANSSSVMSAPVSILPASMNFWSMPRLMTAKLLAWMLLKPRLGSRM